MKKNSLKLFLLLLSLRKQLLRNLQIEYMDSDVQPTVSFDTLPNSLGKQICPPRELCPALSQLSPRFTRRLSSDVPERP